MNKEQLEIAELRRKLRETLSLLYILVRDQKVVRVPYAVMESLDLDRGVIEILKDASSAEWVITTSVSADEKQIDID